MTFEGSAHVVVVVTAIFDVDEAGLEPVLVDVVLVVAINVVGEEELVLVVIVVAWGVVEEVNTWLVVVDPCATMIAPVIMVG